MGLVFSLSIDQEKRKRCVHICGYSLQYALEKGGISKEKLKPDLHKEKQAPDKKQESREKSKPPCERER